jgi:DNA (cytosine-5)-methyltransferase 1
MNEVVDQTRLQCERNGAEATFLDIELFAGAGGMTLGLVDAGLSPDFLFEINPPCCETLRENSTSNGRKWIKGELVPHDVGSVDWGAYRKPVRLLSGGPPCQPFSLGGKHLADQDDRNEFPSTLRAIRVLRPGVVLIENVYGLGRKSFRPYLEYILRQIECPDVLPKHGETWEHHDARVRKAMAVRGFTPAYHAQWALLNSADFGVPQTRARVIILATREDLPWVSMPVPTHSMEALNRDLESGDYWRRHGLKPMTKRMGHHAPPGAFPDPACNRKPWVTVREGLAGLPEPFRKEGDDDGSGHWLIPGARLYRGHSGTELDWPSKTIKAGVHGVAGGENVLRLGHGRHRYLTLREMARLQGFHDDFIFRGTRSRVISQIGNAVPCGLARAIGEALAPALRAFENQLTRTVPKRRTFR